MVVAADGCKIQGPISQASCQRPCSAAYCWTGSAVPSFFAVDGCLDHSPQVRVAQQVVIVQVDQQGFGQVLVCACHSHQMACVFGHRGVPTLKKSPVPVTPRTQFSRRCRARSFSSRGQLQQTPRPRPTAGGAATTFVVLGLAQKSPPLP